MRKFLELAPDLRPLKPHTTPLEALLQWSRFDQVSRTSGSKSCGDGKASGAPVDGMWPGKTAWYKNVMWYKVSNKSYRLLWTVVKEVKINTRGTREPLSIF